MPKIDCHAQHAVVGEQEGHLDNEWQTAARWVDTLFLVQRGNFFIHRLLAGITQAVFFILFLDGFDLRRDALHLQHRLHLRDAQRQQRDVDDQGLDHNRPAPVRYPCGCPLQPQEQWPRDNPEEAEINQRPQILSRATDARHLHRLEYRKRLRAHVHALDRRPLKIADCSAKNFHLYCFVGVGLLRIARNIDRIAQCDHSRVLRVLRNKHRAEILIHHSGPMERPQLRVPSTDLFNRQSLDILIVLVLDAAGRVRRWSRLIAEAGRPHGECRELTALVADGGLYTDYIAVIEPEALSDRQLPVRVFESDVGGYGQRTRL